jgi:sugar-specific transcriptional regulator TrmB
MDDLQRTIEKLGFGENGALIVAALLESTPATAAALAKRTGLSRSSVYAALEPLIARGLVGTTHYGEVKHFALEGHHALMDALRRDERAAAERVKLAATLEEQFRNAGAEQPRMPRVIHFEGVEGLKRVYLSMLREVEGPATLRILRDEFIWEPAWQFVFEPQWREEMRRLKKERGVTTELLVNPSVLEKNRLAERTHEHLSVRFLKSKYQVKQFGLYLLGDVVSTLSFEENRWVGVRITDRHLAANWGRIYEAMWDNASAPRSSKKRPID